MMRTCLFLLAGAYALQLSSFTSYSDLLMLALVAFLALLSRHSFHATACFCAGIALFALATSQVVKSRIAPEFVGDSMVVQLRISGFPEAKGSTVTFIAESVEDPRLRSRIRLSWFEPPVTLRFGDVWQFELRLRRPRGNSNPAVFDYETWLFQRRVAASGYVVSGKRNHLLRSGVLSTRDRLRQRFVDRLSALLPDSDAAAVLAAIAVGARHLISKQQWERYARTGTSHLMAISGLHIGLAAGAVYFFSLLLSGITGFRGNHADTAMLVSLFSAAAYAFISGLEIPARRAVLMIALVVLSVLRRRQLSPLLILCAACLAIVVLDPLATMAPGFKLSFAAVLVLLWLARRRGNSEKDRSYLQRAVAAIKSLAVLQILLLFGLLPLTALIFNRIAFAAPAVNLVAVPLFSFFTVPLTLASLVLTGPLQTLGDRLLLLAAGSVRMLEWGIAMAGSQSAASVSVASITGLAWVIIALPALLVALPPGWPGRHIAWLAVVAVVLYKPAWPLPGCTNIEVLDVGQGLATVVQTSRHVVVFDAGASFRAGSSMGKRVILPYLAGRGIDRIDRLVVSHADIDHSGGVDDIIAEIAVMDLMAGEPVSRPGINSRPCTAGDAWHWDGVDFRIIHPARMQRVDGNDASCVLIVSAGQHRLVLTGDIEKSSEQQLVRAGAVPRSDVVLVPHHGSRTSSTAPFVRALSPTLAIVSAGFGNQWGFPKADVVRRWEAAGAKVLDTASSGAIGLRICEKTGVEALIQHRISKHRVWHEL